MNLREVFGVYGGQPEDRWLWFALRLSVVAFFIAIELVLVLGFAKVLLAL